MSRPPQEKPERKGAPYGARPQGVARLFFFALGWLFCPFPVTAQEGAMLTLGTQWMTLDEFEERAAHQSEDDAIQDAAQSTAQPNAAPPNEPLAKAEPTRPVNLPAPPSFSRRYALDIASTQEAEEENPSWLREKTWRSPEDMEKERAEKEEAIALIRLLGRDPFKIRFASLPGGTMRPVPATRVSRSVLERDTQAEEARKKGQEKESPKVELAKQKETTQACEAFAEYRRRQLEAMENDRQTLAALKAALAELGLVNELSFNTKDTNQ